MKTFNVYFEIGWRHITDINGYDHILFLIALISVYQIKNWKQIVALVTAFTLGHSITLALSVFEFIYIRSSLIEFLIPVTILLTTFFNLVIPTAPSSGSVYIRYMITLAFGLIHGMGFSNYLKNLLNTDELLTPLLAFNIGLEVGQLLIVFVFLILCAIFVDLLKIKKKIWTVFWSGATFSSSIIIILEQLY